MEYRELSADEIIQLGREYAPLVRWEQAREYAQMLYGLVARHLMVAVVNQPVGNSRRETRDHVLILARDVAGERLIYDFTLPWWRMQTIAPGGIDQFQARGSIALDDASLLGDECAAALQDLSERLLGIESLVRWENTAPITFVYRFDEVPQPSEAIVYVEVAENEHTSDAS